MLAACLDGASNGPLRTWFDDVWTDVVGKRREEVLADLCEGIEAWNLIAAGHQQRIGKSLWKELWAFCVVDECPNHKQCLFSFCDLLRILSIPKRYVSSVGSYIDREIEPKSRELVWKVADSTYIEAKGWPHRFTEPASAEPIVTSEFLAYLLRARKPRRRYKIVEGLASGSLFSNLAALQYRVPDTDDPSMDGLWESERLLESTRVAEKREIDRSLSASMTVAHRLLAIYDGVEVLRSELANPLTDAMNYAFKKVQDRSYVSLCYGRDYYLRGLPVSDVFGALQLVDFLIRVQRSPLCNQVLEPSSRDPLPGHIATIVEWLLSNQAPDGYWPVVSLEASPDEVRGKARRHLRHAKDLVEEQGPSANISFYNTLDGIRVLTEFREATGSRVCARCGRQWYGADLKHCGHCGTELA